MFISGTSRSFKSSTSNRFLRRSSSVSSIARNGAGGTGFTSKRVSGSNLVGTFLYLSFVFMFFSFVLSFPNKKPAIVLAIAGLSEIFCYRLENSTHDAKRRGAAVPNGHASLDLLRALLRCKRVCHFLTALSQHHFWHIVKEI